MEAYRSMVYMGSQAALAVWGARICAVLLGVLAVVRGFVGIRCQLIEHANRSWEKVRSRGEEAAMDTVCPHLSAGLHLSTEIIRLAGDCRWSQLTILLTIYRASYIGMKIKQKRCPRWARNRGKSASSAPACPEQNRIEMASGKNE